MLPLTHQDPLLTCAMEALEAEKAAREQENIHYLGENYSPLTGLNMNEMEYQECQKINFIFNCIGLNFLLHSYEKGTVAAFSQRQDSLSFWLEWIPHQ